MSAPEECLLALLSRRMNEKLDDESPLGQGGPIELKIRSEIDLGKLKKCKRSPANPNPYNVEKCLPAPQFQIIHLPLGDGGSAPGRLAPE
ncbi:UNVERIFIED_CONTAM: hypothetical protein K2H54_020602 [Gekko kuhli]